MSNTAIANFYKSTTHDYESFFTKPPLKKMKSMLVSNISLTNSKKQELK